MVCRFTVSAVVMLLLVSPLRADPPTEVAPETQDEQPTDSGPANLIANGDFEKGETSPSGWQSVDGLTSFWATERDGRRGRVLRIDTDVRQLPAAGGRAAGGGRGHRAGRQGRLDAARHLRARVGGACP